MTNDPNSDTAEFAVPPSSAETGSPRPASAEVRVDLGALSHPGRVRPNNEDCYLVARLERVLVPLLTNVPRGDFPTQAAEVGYALVVADGMGGTAAGEVASRLAVRVLVDLQVHTPDWIMRIGEHEEARGIARLAQRYEEVNAALKAEARADPRLTGMGTTLTLAYSLGSTLFLGHVGDSRVYLHRGGELHRLTRDHTFAQALADMGLIRPEEVLRHRFRHVLTRALGAGGSEVVADVQIARLCDGDELLLCTDGLNEMVEDADIAAVLREAGTADEASRALVELALQRGGKDNVTVLVARYRFAPGP
jgi:protein phosphatase